MSGFLAATERRIGTGTDRRFPARPVFRSNYWVFRNRNIAPRGSLIPSDIPECERTGEGELGCPEPLFRQ
mgnify:CR=1 FL=1